MNRLFRPPKDVKWSDPCPRSKCGESWIEFSNRDLEEYRKDMERVTEWNRTRSPFEGWLYEIEKSNNRTTTKRKARKTAPAKAHTGGLQMSLW